MKKNGVVFFQLKLLSSENNIDLFRNLVSAEFNLDCVVFVFRSCQVFVGNTNIERGLFGNDLTMFNQALSRLGQNAGSSKKQHDNHTNRRQHPTQVFSVFAKINSTAKGHRTKFTDFLRDTGFNQ